MTPEELAVLSRLEAAAEPAPWEINCSIIQFDDADRSLVVAARNALPALLQKIQSQEAELDAQEVDLDAKHAKLVAALERESRLREALEETAEGVHVDGKMCWCPSPSYSRLHPEHSALCRMARAALAAEG